MWSGELQGLLHRGDTTVPENADKPALKAKPHGIYSGSLVYSHLQTADHTFSAKK